MKRNARLLIVLALLAIVPLRALAAVTGGLCADYSGHSAGADSVAHQHGAANEETSPRGDSGDASSTCSVCTACCTGASFAAQTPGPVLFTDAHPELIPFRERYPASPHPDKLDRPPLFR